MIFEKGETCGSADLEHLLYKNFEVYYVGYLYFRNFENGIDSLQKIIDEICNNNFECIQELYGNYFIFIKNLDTNVSYTFIDNNGVYKAFIHNDKISTSFFELIEYSSTPFTIDHQSLVEFLHFGFVYFDKTLCKEIEKLNANYIYVIENNELKLVSKNLNTISALPKVSPDTFFKQFAQSLGNDLVSADITGGTDSRLIVSALYANKVHFELATSGQPHNFDFKTGKQISEVLKVPFNPYVHSANNITEDLLNEMLVFTEGQVDISVYHRIFGFIRERKMRNISVYISGVGGELFKDFWWLHEFPFYNSKHTNLEKLFRIRIEPVEYNHSILKPAFANISKNLKTETLNKIQKFVGKTNTNSFDTIYYYYKMQTVSATYLTISNKLIKSYAPLLESDLVRFGFHLPRIKRFYNNFHREFISENCKNISKIKTDSGISCSADFSDKLLDVVGFTNNFVMRITKLVLRKLLKKTYLQESPNCNNLYPNMRALNVNHEILQLLKDKGVLNSATKLEDLTDDNYGKILTFGLILRKFPQKLHF